MEKEEKVGREERRSKALGGRRRGEVEVRRKLEEEDAVEEEKGRTLADSLLLTLSKAKLLSTRKKRRTWCGESTVEVSLG